MNQLTVSPKVHISLYTRDIEAMTDFYSRFLGQQPDKRREDYAKYDLDVPPWVLSFVLKPEMAAAVPGHLGIRVSSPQEVEAWKKHCLAQNIAVREEKGVNCCYAIQDKFWVQDPEGNWLEIYYFHQDAEWSAPEQTEGEGEGITAASSCCKS